MDTKKLFGALVVGGSMLVGCDSRTGPEDSGRTPVDASSSADGGNHVEDSGNHVDAEAARDAGGIDAAVVIDGGETIDAGERSGCGCEGAGIACGCGSAPCCWLVFDPCCSICPE